MKKASNRVVWSPECGGCMMEQRMVNGAWVDHNSYEEGSFPTLDARTKLVVKWYNYRLRQERYKERAERARQKWLNNVSKVDAVTVVMAELSKEINKKGRL